MQFIILRQEEHSYHIQPADTALDALKQYVSEYCCAKDKPFSILCDSGQMTLSELIDYANQYLLCNYAAIHEIYALSEKVY